jgi:hypothetical protein
VHGGQRETGPLGKLGELLVCRAVGEQIQQESGISQRAERAA